AAPQAPGTPVTFTGTAVGCGSPLYEFWILGPGSSTWTVAQAYSSSPTFNWNTTGKPGGTYRFSVWARDASSAGTCNSLGCNDAFVPGFAYALNSPGTAVTALVAPASPQVHGTTIPTNGAAACRPNPLHAFRIL